MRFGTEVDMTVLQIVRFGDIEKNKNSTPLDTIKRTVKVNGKCSYEIALFFGVFL